MAHVAIAPSKQLRGEPLVARILETTLAEVARVGYENVSIEEIALRAGVNKTTIYRRWPTVEVLVVDAFEQCSNDLGFPDTGSLRSDMIGFLRIFRELCLSPALLSIIRMHFSGGVTGKLKEIIDRLSEEGDCDTRKMFERAIARGELPKTTDIDLVSNLMLGSIQNLLLFRHDSCSDETIDRVVDILLVGAAQGGRKVRAVRSVGSKITTPVDNQRRPKTKSPRK